MRESRRSSGRIASYVEAISLRKSSFTNLLDAQQNMDEYMSSYDGRMSEDIEADISVAPGIGFGEYGENFVRIGLVENEHRIRQAARNIKSLFTAADRILGNYSSGQID